MERGVKNSIQDSLDNRKKVVIFGALAVFFIIVAMLISFIPAKRCYDFECFQSSMKGCKKVSYTNEDYEATWDYRILGLRDRICVVEVKLLQVKQGNLELQQLGGLTMECAYPRGVVSYPQKDLNSCHGLLKEEMQGIIIQKLHGYILENLGEIGNAVNALS